MSRTPSFRGREALVLHRADQDAERLMRRCQVLGMTVRQQWCPLDLATTPADFVFVDADAGWTGLLPWSTAPAPLPTIALLGSEAPGRIAWALDQGASAVITKPVAAASVYPALVTAARFHEEAAEARDRMAELEERARMRPLVLAAMRALMSAQMLDEAAAYRSIRQDAMRRRLAVEQVAAEIVAGGTLTKRRPLPEAG